MNKEWYIKFIRESDLIEGIDNSLEEIEVSIVKCTGYPYGHILAFDYLKRNPNEQGLLDAHRILLPELNEYHNPYRDCEVTIGGRSGVIPNLVEHSMEYLFDREIKTVEDVCSFHIDYEHIHPFIDGNGRTGRMLLNGQLNKIGDMVIIPAARRFEYYDFIHYKDVEKFVEFIKALVAQ